MEDFVFGIDIGHNLERVDSGAVGILKEDDLTKDVGTLLISKLRGAGYQVIACKPDKAKSERDSLAQRCAIAHNNKVNLFVSLHGNKFGEGANGAEVYAMGKQGMFAANLVLAEILKLGYFNRGVKNGRHLYVIRNTKMDAILIEMLFIDSKKDVDLYNPETMAEAIFIGLINYLKTIKPNAQ